MSTHYVRLRPRTGKKNGHKFPVRYTIQGARFDATRGWYEITDDAFARLLRNLRLDEADPESPRIFNVCTKEEALAIQAAERRSKVRRDVEDADTGLQAVSIEPRAARIRARTGAVTSEDARKGTDREAPPPSDAELRGRVRDLAGGDEEPTAPAMIDPDPEGEDLATEDHDDRLHEIGRLDGDAEVEAEPEAPAPAPARAKAPAPKAPKTRTRATRAGDDD